MPTTLTNGIQLPDKGSVDWYSSMQSNYNLIDTHLGNTDIHVTAEDKANWDSKQGSLTQAQLDAIAQVATNTNDIATLQTDKANTFHTHSSSDITDIDDYATKQYVDDSISGLVDNAPDALNTLNELSAALNDDSDFATTVTNALGNKANSADLATVATSGSYNDLDDKPTIPTNTSDLTNDNDFVVSSNLATVATSGDYDDLSNKPSIPTNTSDLNNDSGFVTLNDFDIPSKTSDLTNDSGFITSSDVPVSTSDLINDSNFVDTSNSAVASGITSAKVTDYDNHIADTDIHVTTADKTSWNTVTSKANDSDVVHKSGNETVAGVKSFSDNTYITSLNFTNEVPSQSSSNSAVLPIITTVTYTDQSTPQSARLNLRITASGDKSFYPHENNVYSLGVNSRRWATIYGYSIDLGGMYIGNEASGNERTNLYLMANRDSSGQSGAYIGRFRQNRAQGEMSDGEVSFITFDFLENSVRYTRCFTMGLTDWDSDGVPQTYYLTAPNGKGSLGTALQKWSTINGLNPSSLGMPDLNNGIDISSYITQGSGHNEYTPPANGYVSIILKNNATTAIFLYQGDFGKSSYSSTSLPNETDVCCINSIPVVSGTKVNIDVKGANAYIVSAKFFPCQGNV